MSRTQSGSDASCVWFWQRAVLSFRTRPRSDSGRLLRSIKFKYAKSYKKCIR
ncbi:Orf20 [Heliothis zea nudivirus]|uniref:Orf20 n=1 Tax=Heliothis zea nudivirus 1 TaxID=3116536 RepID=Q8JKU1_9VIRU|nr:Orf20 [Heliothis zea nudivirus]AAN04315.1 Orf20 [Heliothis zea nudivirus]